MVCIEYANGIYKRRTTLSLEFSSLQNAEVTVPRAVPGLLLPVHDPGGPGLQRGGRVRMRQRQMRAERVTEYTIGKPIPVDYFFFSASVPIE